MEIKVKFKDDHRDNAISVDTVKPVYNDHLMGYFSAFLAT